MKAERDFASREDGGRESQPGGKAPSMQQARGKGEEETQEQEVEESQDPREKEESTRARRKNLPAREGRIYPGQQVEEYTARARANV